MSVVSVPGLTHVTVQDIRTAWQLRLGAAGLTVRGAAPRDLPAVAQLHRRCSAKTLLDRYRNGGLPPAIPTLDRHGRDQLSFVAQTDEGRVVATARVAPDASHPVGSAEIAMLVEDDWQHLGVGRALLRHCAAAAVLTGYRQLIAYPGTTAATVQRMMSRVGTTRSMSEPLRAETLRGGSLRGGTLRAGTLVPGPAVTESQRHFHTVLPENAKFGLGQFRSMRAAQRYPGATAVQAIVSSP